MPDTRVLTPRDNRVKGDAMIGTRSELRATTAVLHVVWLLCFCGCTWAAVTTTGCSSGAGPGGDGGVVGGGAGASGTGAGGTAGSGVGPEPQGAVSLFLTTVQTPATAVCTPGVHWVNVPFSASGGQQSTATTKGTSAVNGQNMMSVQCTVRGNGSTFDVSGELKSPASDSMGKPINPTIVTLHTVISPDEAGATGSVATMDGKTAKVYCSDTCAF